MNNQVKVSTTQKYSDSQGTHIVCEGKLLFIKSEESHDSLFYDDGGKSYYYKSIIISETEEIEEGDMTYGGLGDEFKIRKYKYDEPLPAGKFHMFKILALPEHFSDKHLQAIVNGKMKDGDEVLIKCESYEIQDVHSHFVIHLDQQNHITLFPAKKSLEEEAEFSWLWFKPHTPKENREAIRLAFITAFKSGAKWAKKNNY